MKIKVVDKNSFCINVEKEEYVVVSLALENYLEQQVKYLAEVKTSQLRSGEDYSQQIKKIEDKINILLNITKEF